MPTTKSVCYICNNTYYASFGGANDAAYTAKHGQPPEMKERRERRERGGEKRKGRGGRKGREGRE